VTIGIFAAFWAVSILFVITPGADWAYAISAGMRNRAIFPAVAGLLFGHLAATLVVAAGVGALVVGVAGALATLTALGSGYLLWLAFGMIAHPPVPSGGDTQASNASLRWLAKGFCVSGLNPKVFLLFLALLPQFADPAAPWPIPAQMVALGLAHILNCGVVYLLVGFGAKAALSTRPRAARAVSRVSGIVMIAIAVTLLAARFVHHPIVLR
jgi:threonine/homoserine/homoserine lactone efflux protein